MSHTPSDDEGLREEIEHMFASAWQDGVHHLNPKYLRRDKFFTDRVMALISQKVIEARIEAVLYVDHMLRFENIPLHIVQAESLKQYINQLEAQLAILTTKQDTKQHGYKEDK